MRFRNVLGRLHTPASLARAVVITFAAALLACSSSRGKDWKDEKAYGAKMARLGFWREALFRFEKAAKAHPDDPQIQNDLAVAYESLGETAKALSAYRRAIELAPSDPKIKRNYARFAEYYTSVQRGAATGSAPASPTPAPGAAGAAATPIPAGAPPAAPVAPTAVSTPPVNTVPPPGVGTPEPPVPTQPSPVTTPPPSMPTPPAAPSPAVPR